MTEELLRTEKIFRERQQALLQIGNKQKEQLLIEEEMNLR